MSESSIVDDGPGREDYDRRRDSTARGRAVCHAPFVALARFGDGQWAPCRFTTLRLPEDDASSAWQGEALLRLRQRFRDYRVKQDECETCAAWWRAGLAGRSPALGVFDSLAGDEVSSPKHLFLELGSELDEASLEAFSRWIPDLRELVLELHHVDAASARAVFDRLAEVPGRERPDICFECHGPARETEIPRGVTRVRGFFSARELASREGRDLASDLGRRASQAGASFDLAVLVSSDDWYDLARALAFSLEVGARAIPLECRESLGRLRPAELETLHDFAWRWGARLGFESFSEKQQEPWRAFLDSLRRLQLDVEPEGGGKFELPAPEHAIVDGESELLGFLNGLTSLYAHPSVEAFLRRLVEREGFLKAARDRVSLRMAALWLGSTFPGNDVDSLLAALYENPSVARGMIAEEEEAVRGLFLETASVDWRRNFRLDVGERQLRFEKPPAEGENVSGRDPIVTVLIPAYRHAGFVAGAIESALGQSNVSLRVLVVDDCSDDGTVDVANGISDPRLEVRSNDRNLGLGASLAQALDAIETPYLAVLNSDDLLHPERLWRCLGALEDSPDTLLVATEVQPIDSEARHLELESCSPIFDGRNVYDWLSWRHDLSDRRGALLERPFETLLEGNLLLTSSNLVGRTSFFRESRKRFRHLEFTVDWQLLLDASRLGGLKVLAEKLLGYRLHRANTVWFDDDRAWRYYLEVHRIAARVLREMTTAQENPGDKLELVSQTLAGPLLRNSNIDPSGLLLGHVMEDLELEVSDLDRAWTREAVDRLTTGFDEGKKVLAVAREASSSRSGEQLQSDLQKAFASVARLKLELRETRILADARVREASESERRLEDVLEDRDHLRENVAELENRLALERDEREGERARRRELESNLDLAGQGFERLLGEWEEAVERASRLEGSLKTRAIELAEVRRSPAYRLGSLVLDRWKLLPALYWARGVFSRFRQRLIQTRLSIERRWPRARPYRALATICWNFPIYSQTFVYQELISLQERGFELRHVFTKDEDRGHLQERFSDLWPRRRRLWLDLRRHRADFAHYRSRIPAKVDRLVALLAEASDLTAEQILDHSNFLEAFTFTRMVEAWAPHYLHSYFFYDRSLHSLVAAFLLDLPRGISCYADHLLDDYELKVVPLHLRLSDVVIATSNRIKSELLGLAPEIDPEKILVKANAVDKKSFPFVERREPERGEPFRIVCISRLEPKKGLLYLIEAVRILKDEKGCDVELHLVGDVDRGVEASERYKEKIDELLERRDLWGTVHLEGRCDQDEVRRFLEISQIFSAPFVELESGDKDGIPTSLLEAMATGLPVVASDAGSIKEVVRTEVEGLVVPQRQAQALAQALEALLRDPRRRLEMGRAAADRVAEAFDVGICEGRFHDRVLALVNAGREDAPAEAEELPADS